MRRLHAEHERLRQQEQLQLALVQQQQQQQQQQAQAQALAAAQEQELARFRDYHPLLNLTVDIVETYRKCRPEFHYESALRPRRVLTHPSEGVLNDGFDNENSDYVLYVNDVIGDKDGQQYIIIEMLGSGTFGQVVKCQNLKTGEFAAVKVIKNKTAYYNQSMMEVQMLELLNKKYDVHDRHHILRLREWFVFRNHLVIVSELLLINLYDLLKQNQCLGLSTNLVRVLVQQILDAMIVLKKAQVIHADLKPENILLEGMEKPVIKVIDFGSACFEWQTTFVYIQSRFYRSPEILLGLPYSSRIDMWSLGCIVAELYLGNPLFPGTSEYNQLSRIVDLLGIPPKNMLEKARRTDEFFNYLGPGTWDFKGIAQYSSEHNVEEKPSKRFFVGSTLEEIVSGLPLYRKMSVQEQQREYQSRIALVDFLRGLLQLDPDLRWSPQQAAMHPFITGEPLVGPFVPPSDAGAPGGTRGPYGAAPGSGHAAGGSHRHHHHHHHHHHAAHGGSSSNNSNSNSNSNNGVQPYTIGYSSAYGGGAGRPGGAGHAAQPAYGPATSLGSTMAWGYAHAGSAGHGMLSIPGAFPAAGNGVGTDQAPPPPPLPLRNSSRGRLRSATLGHQLGAAYAQGAAAAAVIGRSSGDDDDDYNQSAAAAGGAHSYGYSQPEGFLGVDPRAPHTGDSPAAGGGARGAAGRLDASRSGSECSADSLASRSAGAQAGSRLPGPKPPAQRSYLLSAREQLTRQRRLRGGGGGGMAITVASPAPLSRGASPDGPGCRHDSPHSSYGDAADVGALGADSSPGATAYRAFTHPPPPHPHLAPPKHGAAALRLVSNMSPLTLPSTPGSSQHGSRHAGSARGGRAPGLPPAGRLSGHSSSNSSRGSIASGGGSAFGRDAELSRLLREASESEASLARYSMASDDDDDDDDDDGSSQGFIGSGPANSDPGSASIDGDAKVVGYERLSDSEPMQLLSLPDLRACSSEWWHRGADGHASLPLVASERQCLPAPDTGGSIYLQPRYARYSQDVLDGKAVVRLASSADDGGDGDGDGDDGIDARSIISQDLASCFASPLSGSAPEDAADGLSTLDLGSGPSEPCTKEGRDSAWPDSTAGYSDFGADSDSDSDGSDSGSEDDGQASQDTILFVGKLRLAQQQGGGAPRAARPKSGGLCLSPSLISQPAQLAPAQLALAMATYPQKVMKRSQQAQQHHHQLARAAEPASLAGDSLRMVEALRRMGKWQSWGAAAQPPADSQAARANQFFYDPVIVAMSPRLMPQPGPSG